MDSLMGAVPESWDHRRLDECYELQPGPGGSVLKSADTVAGGVPVVTARDIDSRNVISAPVGSVGHQKAERLDRYRLAEGDILLARIRATTRHALVGVAQVGWLMGGSCIRLRVRAGSHMDVVPGYLSCYLTHPSVQEWLSQQTLQGVVPTLNAATVAALPLALPPVDVQVAIVDLARAFEDKIQIHNDIVRATRALRDLVLPQLLSGQIAAD